MLSGSFRTTARCLLGHSNLLTGRLQARLAVRAGRPPLADLPHDRIAYLALNGDDRLAVPAGSAPHGHLLRIHEQLDHSGVILTTVSMSVVATPAVSRSSTEIR